MGLLDGDGLDPGPGGDHFDEEDGRFTDRASDRVAVEILRRLRLALGSPLRPDLEPTVRRVQASAATARIPVPSPGVRDVTGRENHPQMRLLAVTADSVEKQVEAIIESLTDAELRLLVRKLIRAEPGDAPDRPGG